MRIILDTNIFEYGLSRTISREYQEIHQVCGDLIEDVLQNDILCMTSYQVAEVYEIFRKCHLPSSIETFQQLIPIIKIVDVPNCLLGEIQKKSQESNIHLWDYMVTYPLRGEVERIYSFDNHLFHYDFTKYFEVIRPLDFNITEGKKPQSTENEQFKSIPITKSVFDQEDFQVIVKPLKTGWVVQGPNVKKFEEMFAEFCGVKYAIATTSCTTALHLSLLALSIKPGDEVILPSFTFIATANAVEYCGARPIFCDIDLKTFNIDLNQLEKMCKNHRSETGAKIKAVIPVGLFGLSSDMNGVREIAEKYNLKILEDAACALGTFSPVRSVDSNIERSNQYGDSGLVHAGGIADAACFSFHPRKAITTGEGGMIITNNNHIHDLVRKLRDHGASKSDLERHMQHGGSLLPEFNILGYNYRMTDIQGALGITQMRKARSIIESRREAAQQYNELLKEIKWLRIPIVPEGYIHSYQSYVCLYGGSLELREIGLGVEEIGQLNWEKAHELNKKRNLLMRKMEEEGITVRQGTHAVHTLGYYQKRYGLRDYDYPMSYLADRLSITLPLYAGMTKEEQDYVIRQLMS